MPHASACGGVAARPPALQARPTLAKAASATNPGIPPSSLMSFLRVKPSIAGMVLTDFDK
jgi:nicastrin